MSHNFALLPTEIRLKILSYLIPEGRIVDVFTYQSTPIIWAAPHCFPALFHICHDSRAIGFKYFDTSLATSTEDALVLRAKNVADYTSLSECRRTLVNPDRDIIFLQDPPEIRRRLLVSSLATLAAELRPNITANVRFLAIPYYNWHKARQANLLKHMLEFKALEQLYVPFMAGSLDMRDWSAGLLLMSSSAEISSHLREIEEGVDADLDVLAQEYPDWKRPVVTIFRDKGKLAEALGVA